MSHMEKRSGLNFGREYLCVFTSFHFPDSRLYTYWAVFFWWLDSEKPSLCYSPTWFCSMRCRKKKEGKNTCILPYLGIFVEDSDTCFKYFVPLSYFANLHKECLLFFMRNSIWKHWRCITIQQRNVIIQSSKSRLLVNLTNRKVVLIIMLVETKLILA